MTSTFLVNDHASNDGDDQQEQKMDVELHASDSSESELPTQQFSHQAFARIQSPTTAEAASRRPQRPET